MGRSLTIPVEVVTPLFLGGSEVHDGMPELRPPAFKGTLRFWLRALLGAHLGDESIERLRQAEAEVFGSAAFPSPRVSPISVRIQGSATGEAFPAPLGQGLRYLFFSMGQRRHDERAGKTRTVWRRCFPPRTRFDLILQCQASGDNEPLTRAGGAFWLLARLGGLGARSRRGAGGLRAIGNPIGWPEKLPSLETQAETPDQLRMELEVGVRTLRGATGSALDDNMKHPCSFDVLHPETCEVYVVDRAWKSWDEALDALGGSLQSFRNRLHPDYQNVKDVVGERSNRLEPVRRAAFGLPIVFYFRSLQGAKGTLEGSDHDRRASPMLLKVEQLANGEYVLILTVFRAALLTDKERLKLQSQRRQAFASLPDLSVIEEFLSALGRPGRQFLGRLFKVNLG